MKTPILIIDETTGQVYEYKDGVCIRLQEIKQDWDNRRKLIPRNITKQPLLPEKLYQANDIDLLHCFSSKKKLEIDSVVGEVSYEKEFTREQVMELSKVK